MIIFFYFTKDVKILHQEFEFKYEHKFESIPNQDRSKIPFEKCYWSTPSDFQSHMDNLTNQYGRENMRKDGLVNIVKPDLISKHKSFPKHIGFDESFNLQALLEPYKGKNQVKIAFVNAMSNALGDHLIGMKAFDYWQEKVREYLSGSDVSITLFQLNPMRLAPITKQWHPKFQQIYMMPNRVQRLVEHDLYIDLGSLLLRENFGNQPMIDFFFEALSIDPKTVPNDKKRISYSLPENQQLTDSMNQIFKTIRSTGRPVLLFHHKSTSAVRQMSDERARVIVKNIIDNSDYFVISACGLEFTDKRFLDLSRFSNSTDAFASIISRCDGIITVDTSTYHFADAFNKPTVVLFTTIEPEYRIKYYPYTRGIMLEEKGGSLYGRHKSSKKQELAEKENQTVDKMFASLDINKVLSELKSIKGVA